MNEAIGAYRHVSASPEFREIERMMSKARHDEAQAIRNAERRAEKRRDEHWQIVAEENMKLRSELAKLKSQHSEN